MPSHPMAAAAGGSSTASLSRCPAAICPLRRTLSAPAACPQEEETHRTPGFSREGAPAAPEAVGDQEQQRQNAAGSGDGCGGTAVEQDREWLKEMRGSLLVVASLLASVTYQAGMNPPGGLWQDTSPEGSKNPHRAGDPVLQNMDRIRFNLFYWFNSFSFGFSVGVMMLLIAESVLIGLSGGPRWVRSLAGFETVRAMKYMMFLSLLSLGVAFAVGSCRDRWRSLYAVFSPIYYFLISVTLELLHSIFRRRQKKNEATTPAPQQVEINVEHSNDHL